MRAINHAMTGAIIGLSITNPIALPLAVASHFALDGLPHHKQSYPSSYNSLSFKTLLFLDIVLCFGLVLVVILRHPEDWWLGAICAFVAASPDFMWFGDFMAEHRGELPKKHTNSLVRFHAWVQWFQRPIGIVVELAWATLALVVLGYLLAR